MSKFINLTECCGLGNPKRVITVNIANITEVYAKECDFPHKLVRYTVVRMKRMADSTAVTESHEEVLRRIKLAKGVVVPEI